MHRSNKRSRRHISSVHSGSLPTSTVLSSPSPVLARFSQLKHPWTPSTTTQIHPGRPLKSSTHCGALGLQDGRRHLPLFQKGYLPHANHSSFSSSLRAVTPSWGAHTAFILTYLASALRNKTKLFMSSTPLTGSAQGSKGKLHPQDSGKLRGKDFLKELQLSLAIEVPKKLEKCKVPCAL